MRLVLLSLLLVPVAAFADPVTLTAISTFWATYGTAIQIGLMVATTVYGDAKRRKQERDAKKKANANLQDRLVTAVETTMPHVYVYGRAKVGSAVVAIFTSGDKDQYKHLVCVHAAHECDAFEEIYVANKALGALDASGWVTGGDYYTTTNEPAVETKTTQTFTLAHTPIVSTLKIIERRVGEDNDIVHSFTLDGNTVTLDAAPIKNVSVRYQYVVPHPRVRVSKHLGTPTDPADAYLMSVVPDKWTANHVLRDFTYTVITLDLNQSEFQGGIPEIHVLLRGKKLYDPRTGTRYWSQNNALVAYDYLTGPCCKVTPAELPVSDYITAANACDESYWFGKRYTFNGTITSDEDRAGVLERIAQSMAGGIVSTTWSLYAGKYVAPVMALTVNPDGSGDCVGSLAINPGMSDADIYNTVKGQYISSETGYIATDYKPYVSPVYLAADTKELSTNIDLPYTDSTQRAHNLCRIFTEDQRNGYTVKGSFSRKTWALQIGQRVTLTSALFGWNAKVFRVTDKSYSPTKAVELTLKEDGPTIWDFSDAVLVDETSNSGLPNPFKVKPITGLSCESGTDALLIAQDGTIISRILATFDQSDNPYVNANGKIEFQWQKENSDVWQSTEAKGDAMQAFLSPVEDGAYYVVRARAAVPSMGTQSDWAYVLDHKVIGKTEPPPDISAFSITNGVLSWVEISPTEVLDLAGYKIRFQYGQNESWANATDLHTGLILASPWEPSLMPPGDVTLMIKAVDTSGNESVNVATIYANFGDPVVANLILSYDDKAAGFPGTKTNCSVSGGNLLANDSGGLFWGANKAPFWGKDTALFWPTATYKEAAYITGYSVQPEEAGSRLTLQIDIDASSYTIEYRYDTQGYFWGNDANFFWPADDTKPFWPAPTAWQTWPGAIEKILVGRIEFRIVMEAGTVQGTISDFTLQFDVEDESEVLEDVSITAAGLRLPITKSYRSIKVISWTLQDNGGSAVRINVTDKGVITNGLVSAGPMVNAKTSAGVNTPGISDFIIQGVKG